MVICAGFCCLLGAFFIGTFFIGEALRAVFPSMPNISPRFAVFPAQQYFILALVIAWWGFEAWRAKPFLLKGSAGWSDPVRAAFLLICSPFFLAMDRLGYFAINAPAAPGVGPLMGSPLLNFPPIAAAERLAAFKGPPPRALSCFKPLMVALSPWPAMAIKAIPAALIFSTAMLATGLALTLTPIQFVAMLLGSLKTKISNAISGASLATAVGSLKSKAAASADRLVAEGSRDLAQAEAQKLLQGLPEANASTKGPPRI
jgi:hypothetical protein